MNEEKQPQNEEGRNFSIRRGSALSKYMMMALAMASLPAMNNSRSNKGPKEIQYKPVEKPIPNGCKQYWFDEYGDFRTDKMRKDLIVFSCVAQSDKSAIKKYQRWLQNQK